MGLRRDRPVLRAERISRQVQAYRATSEQQLLHMQQYLRYVSSSFPTCKDIHVLAVTLQNLWSFIVKKSIPGVVIARGTLLAGGSLPKGYAVCLLVLASCKLRLSREEVIRNAAILSILPHTQIFLMPLHSRVHSIQ